MSIGWTILKIAALVEGTFFVKETVEKHDFFNQSREYCNMVGKPLLRIGMHRAAWEPPNGDFTLDIDPTVQEIPGGVWGDERKMPFANKEFGVCFNEHTLEHLQTPDDVEAAVSECVRVADYAVFLTPNPYRPSTTLFETGHLLRLWLDDASNTMVVAPNHFRTGLGGDQGADVSHPPISSFIVTKRVPKVIKISSTYIVEG